MNLLNFHFCGADDQIQINSLLHIWLIIMILLAISYFACWLCLVGAGLDDERKPSLIQLGNKAERILTHWLSYPMKRAHPEWPFFLNRTAKDTPPGSIFILLLGVNLVLQSTLVALLLTSLFVAFS